MTKWVVCVLALAAVAGPAVAQPSVGLQTIQQTPQTLTGGLVRDGTPHTCVIDTKSNTKTVYTTVCKDYCRYDGSIMGILHRCFGDGGCPCEMRTRTILVKKIVPAPDTQYCVVKEAPGGYSPGTLPCPAPVPGAMPGPGYAPVPGAVQLPGYVGQNVR
ncbi:MAG TPA: hypothetical protein VKE74_03075 [Gemmataceae bacterium]|nr:hypothetical protein [Gemmataceae bacterium]